MSATSNQWLGIRTPTVVLAANPTNAYVRTPSGLPPRMIFVGFPWVTGIHRFDQTYASNRLQTSVVAPGVQGNAQEHGIYRARIVDEAGSPLPGARVRISNSRPSGAGGPTVEVDVLSDANGNITWTPNLWFYGTPDLTAKDTLVLGAYYKNPVNPGAGNPTYLFAPFGPFTVQVVSADGTLRATRVLYWPTSSPTDTYGWYPVAEVYDVITAKPSEQITVDQLPISADSTLEYIGAVPESA